MYFPWDVNGVRQGFAPQETAALDKPARQPV